MWHIQLYAIFHCFIHLLLYRNKTWFSYFPGWICVKSRFMLAYLPSFLISLIRHLKKNAFIRSEGMTQMVEFLLSKVETCSLVPSATKKTLLCFHENNIHYRQYKIWRIINNLIVTHHWQIDDIYVLCG
jgi:hypothetical protein